MIEGAADTIDIDPLAGLVHIAGRDRSAALIEARTQETFANQTSSEIAASLAARHGLDADAQDTSTPVGRYWQLEHDRTTLNEFGRATTEWDLLATLAQHEGFDVWVTGTTLHFRPADTASILPATLRPAATIDGPANLTSLRLTRTLTLARDIEVTVKSWNARQRTAFVQTARGYAGATGNGTRSAVQKYVFVVPNLTPGDALTLAQRHLAELTSHERVVHASMPGDLSLAPRQPIRLDATGTDFDQTYLIDQVERSLNVQTGFTQHLRARSASPTDAGSATSPADIPVATVGTP